MLIIRLIAFSRQYIAGPGLGPQFVKSLIGSAGLRVISMALTFLVGVQLARGLGVEGYGVYGVAMSAISILAIPAEFGFPQLLIREVAANQVNSSWGRMRGILYWANRASLQISLITMAAVIVWLVLSGDGIHQPLAIPLLAGIVMLPLGVLGRQRGAVLLGLHHPIKGQLPDIIVRPAIFSIMLLSFSLFTFPLSAGMAMSLGAMSAAIAFMAASLMLRAALPSELQSAEIILDTRSWWKSAIPMAVTEGMRGLQGNIAILILSALTTTSSAGIFRVASSVSVIATMPITLFLIIGAPLISRLYAQGDKPRLQRLSTWVSVGMTLCSITLTIPFLIAGTPLLSYLFGSGFGAANTPLLIMCLGGIMFSSFGAAVVLLNMCGHERQVSISFGISVATLLILIVPMVSFFKENGAAVASSIAMVTGNMLMWKYARDLLDIDTSIFSLLQTRVKLNGEI